MSPPSVSSRWLATAVGSWLEPLVCRFEEAWQRGERPALDAYLPCDAEARRITLVELIHLELELRLKAGEAARVEEYLTRYPELADDEQAVLALLQTELRARREPQLSNAEYQQRFPQFAQEFDAGLGTLSTDGRPASLATLWTHTDNVTPTSGGELPRLPGYEIEKELGRGAMGIVYKARHLHLNRVVALKMILHAEQTDAAERRRSQAEAQALARLNHPNIVQIYEVGEHQGQPFLALEFVEGGTLAERLKRQPLSVTEAVKLTATLARAVHAAHESHIVHRDLKPANILLTGDGTPKISDFSLAKHLDAETLRTQSGAIFGTPAYMAPEQASGRSKAIGPAVDIHALGVILYELLARQPPFRGLTILEVLQQVQSAEPISLRRLAPKVPRDLETICHKCLRKAPEARYHSALELAEDLERFLRKEPIRARPVSAWEHGLKWVRHHPAAAVLLAVLLLVVVSTIGAWVKFTAYLGQALAARTEELQNERQKRERALQRDLRFNRYVDNIRQAAQLWQRHEISQCYDFMTIHQWIEGKDDPRGFEWHYLRRWCDHQPRALKGHTAAVQCVRFHPNGKWLASCSEDRTIRFWEVETGRLCATLTGEGELVREIAFSPDGRTLACNIGESVQFWDVAEQRRQKVLVKELDYFQSIAFSPRGNLLALLRIRNTFSEIQVWDLQTQRVHRWHSIDDPIRLAFASDGQMLAIGYENGTVLFHDAATGNERGRLLTKHPAHALAFAHQSPLLAVGGGDGIVSFWDVETRQPVGEAVGHAGMVNSLAFSPDDRTLLSASEDGTIRSWDTASQHLQAILRTRNQPFRSVAFHPEGHVFAAASADGIISLWSTITDEKTGALQTAVDPAGPVAFSPEGQWLAVAGRDQTVRLFDSATRQIRRTLYGWHGEWQDLAFSPDGKHVAAACSDHRVYVWDTETGRRLHQLLEHQDTVTCVTYSPDGKWLIAGGADNRIAVWEMPAGRLQSLLDAHEGPVTGLAFHPKGAVFASIGRDKCLRLWSVPTFQPLHRLARHEELLGVAFTDAGRTLLLNGEITGVSAWQYKGGQELAPGKCLLGPARFLAVASKTHRVAVSSLQTIRVYDRPDRNAAFHLEVVGTPGSRRLALSPEGTLLVLCQRGGPLQWWELNRSQIRDTDQECPYAVHTLAFDPSGQMLITGSRNRVPGTIRTPFPFGVYDWQPQNTVGDRVRFWSVSTGQAKHVLSETLTLASQPFVAVSPDGRTLATGADDGSVSLWDLATGKRRVQLLASRHSRTYVPLIEAILTARCPVKPKFYGDQMHALTFSSDGRLLAAATEDGHVQLWDASTGKEWATLPGAQAEVSCLAFSPDSKLLASNNGAAIELWTVRSPEGHLVRWRQLLGHTAVVRSLAFSADGRFLASGGDDADIRLWDLASGAEGRQLQGHIARVNSLAFHADGRTLASAGWDGTVRLWHIATGRELMAIRCAAPLIHAVAFSPDGQTLAAGGERQNGRGDIYFWNAAP
jgi:WD40 repeat protein/tRNA A-37 threonylcarbamoyl transferase component Bud32